MRIQNNRNNNLYALQVIRSNIMFLSNSIWYIWTVDVKIPTAWIWRVCAFSWKRRRGRYEWTSTCWTTTAIWSTPQLWRLWEPCATSEDPTSPSTAGKSSFTPAMKETPCRSPFYTILWVWRLLYSIKGNFYFHRINSSKWIWLPSIQEDMRIGSNESGGKIGWRQTDHGFECVQRVVYSSNRWWWSFYQQRSRNVVCQHCCVQSSRTGEDPQNKFSSWSSRKVKYERLFINNYLCTNSK